MGKDIISTFEELEELFRLQDRILQVISNTSVHMIDSAYKEYGDLCYVCADGRCVDIQSEIE